jgi:predicted small lipoprotein YifL
MGIRTGIRLTLLMVTVLHLTACGMRGPLYLPDQVPADQKPTAQKPADQNPTDQR